MTILITGANRGIGAAMLQHYRDAGAPALGTARNAAAGLEPLDVTSESSVAALAHRLNGDPLELLVCNAGVYPDKGMATLSDYSAQTFADAFAANVTGVFLCVQALLPQLQRAKAPRIAIISSIMASTERAPGGAYAYRASKAAVLNFGRNLAADLSTKGIAVGIYHPGWVRTDMGGRAADIDEAEAVAGLTARFEELDLASTGRFCSYDGTPIPY